MRIAVISDIHGNHLALEAVLEDIRAHGIKQILNLGDHFGGPLEAGKTADILMKQTGMISILGNHDRFLLELPFEALGNWDQPAYQQLSERHLAWTAALPATAMFDDRVFMCHGTPHSDSVQWLDRQSPRVGTHMSSLSEIEQEARGIAAPLMLCGHTHVPRIVRLSDGRQVLNPGSVGCPGFKDTRAEPYSMHTGHVNAAYAIVEEGSHGWSFTFRQIPYDNLAMAEIARSKGDVDWANALTGGWIV
jgi:predicted phosphodiesterase